MVKVSSVFEPTSFPLAQVNVQNIFVIYSRWKSVMSIYMCVCALYMYACVCICNVLISDEFSLFMHFSYWIYRYLLRDIACLRTLIILSSGTMLIGLQFPFCLQAIKNAPGCIHPVVSRVLPYIGPILNNVCSEFYVL